MLFAVALLPEPTFPTRTRVTSAGHAGRGTQPSPASQLSPPPPIVAVRRPDRRARASAGNRRLPIVEHREHTPDYADRQFVAAEEKERSEWLILWEVQLAWQNRNSSSEDQADLSRSMEMTLEPVSQNRKKIKNWWCLMRLNRFAYLCGGT